MSGGTKCRHSSFRFYILSKTYIAVEEIYAFDLAEESQDEAILFAQEIA
jgi:hypothetical protein